MQILTYDKIINVEVVSQIPLIGELSTRLIKRTCLNVPNSLLICYKDSRISDTKDYAASLKQLNDILVAKESYMVIMRHKTENPSLFNGDRWGFSNITFVKNSAIIETASCNILCISGGITVNRTWIKKNQQGITSQVYYDDEMPIFDVDNIREYVNGGKTINGIVTNENVLSFMTNPRNIIWTSVDENLEKDMSYLVSSLKDILEITKSDGQNAMIFSPSSARLGPKECVRISLSQVNFYNPCALSSFFRVAQEEKKMKSINESFYTIPTFTITDFNTATSATTRFNINAT